MNTNLQVFRQGVKASWKMYSVELTPAVVFGSKIPRAVLQALFFVLIARAAGGEELARFALVGNAVHAAVLPSIVFMAIVIELERWAGTLPQMIAAPAHWLPVMIGRSAATFGDALFNMAVVLGVLLPLMAPDITLFNLLRAAPLLIITVASATGLGWLIGAISLPIRWGTLISNMTGYALMVLCGVNFPFTALPGSFQAISGALPITHGLLAVRAIVDGAAYGQVMPLVGKEILIGLIYSTAAWLLFNRRLKTARQRGSLELV